MAGLIKITSADRYFSMCVRKRANWKCERCFVAYPPQPTQALHCAHFMGRGSWSTRFDPQNAVSLDMGCHLYFTGRPAEFADWYVARVGLEEVERLRRLSKQAIPGIRKRVREIGQFYKREYDDMRLGGTFRAWLPDIKFEVVL